MENMKDDVKQFYRDFLNLSSEPLIALFCQSKMTGEDQAKVVAGLIESSQANSLRAKELEVKIPIMKMELEVMKEELKIKKKMFEVEIKIKNKELEMMDKKMAIMDKEIQIKEKELEFMERELKLKEKLYEEDIKLRKAQTQRVLKDIDLLEIQEYVANAIKQYKIDSAMYAKDKAKAEADVASGSVTYKIDLAKYQKENTKANAEYTAQKKTELITSVQDNRIINAMDSMSNFIAGICNGGLIPTTAMLEEYFKLNNKLYSPGAKLSGDAQLKLTVRK